MTPEKTPSAFGIPLTPEFLLKFAALIFSMGMLYQRINGLEEKMDLLIKPLNDRLIIVESTLRK